MIHELYYDQEHLNASGLREGIHTFTIDGKLQYAHLYVNGLLTGVTEHRHSVEGQSPLLGQYLQGLPYQGYFVSYLSRELYLIDVYEKGMCVAQFSETEDSETHPTALLKTSYLNGKPWQGTVKGIASLLFDRQLYSNEHYTNGLITHVDLRLSDNYDVQNLRIDFEPNGYKIYKLGDLEDKGQIQMSFTDDRSGTISFRIGSEVCYQFEFVWAASSEKFCFLSGEVLYFKKEDDYAYQQRFHIYINEEMLNDYSSILLNMFFALGMQPNPPFSPNGSNDYTLLFHLEEPLNFFNILHIGANNLPQEGFHIQKDADGTYSYIQFDAGKALARAEHLSKEALESSLHFRLVNQLL